MVIINKYIKIFFSAAIILVCSFDISLAQWSNNPSSDTKIVTDVVDAVNISALSDQSGGAYIFWQDKKGQNTSNIYYLHINQTGEASFRSDGKAVTTSSGVIENPITVADPFGNSLVMWKESDSLNRSELFIQKLSKNGLRFWGTNGLQITNTESEKIDYSLGVDNNGFGFVSCVSKTSQLTGRYFVRLQKINPNGRMISDSSKRVVYNSNDFISETKIVPDNKGGSYVFWLESISQTAVLRAQYIDSLGVKSWGEKPLTISKTNNSVINYSVGKIGKHIYSAITYSGKQKTVYQQLISDNGKLLWGSSGKLLTYQQGSQFNPQFVFVDSSVVVSWTNELKKIKDVFIQRFDLKGNQLWKNNGEKVINITGNQFGQKMIYDGKGGVIIAWIDKQGNNSFANLLIQKVNLQGEFVWKKDGINISSSEDMQKSYLNLVPDDEGGAIAIFRGSIDGRNSIYGQKIFSTGTYASQILGFSAETVNDSIKIFWYAANETDGTTYLIQQAKQNGNNDDNWKTIGTIKAKTNRNANYYEFYDVPDFSGSILFRIVKENNGKEVQKSLTAQVDYFYNVESITLAQNFPNPFSDSTSITFYLPKKEVVTLEIFNSNLETINKIEKTEFPAGKNSYVFSAKGIKPGVYFYRLKVGDFVDVKKMVVAN